MSWPTVALGDVCSVVTGGTPSRKNLAYFGGEIPWVKIGDMSQGVVKATDETITSEALDASSAKILPAGTVVISIFATIGRTAVLGVDAATNQAIAGVTPKDFELLSPQFLRRHLDASTAILVKQASGVAQLNINSRILKSLPLAIPPLEEQRGIAEVLDQADALRAKRRDALSQQNELTQSVFIHMFGDPAGNPRSWPRFSLGSLAAKYSDGPFGSNLKSSDYTSSGVRVVRLQNIGVGEFIDDNRAYVSEEHFRTLTKHECQPGDVLIGTLGDPNLRACIQPGWLERALNKADCVQFRADDSQVSAQYICALLNLPATEMIAQGMARGQTRTRISMGRLRALEVPLPPLDLQHEFARRVRAIEQLKESHLVHLAELDALFASLQARAFRGEL